MTRLKVLFADDHIPEDNIPYEEDKIKEALRTLHPGWSDKNIEEWTKIYSYTRQVQQMLSDSDYAVTSARTYREAIKAATGSHFHIAIVDIGWFADPALPAGKQASAGLDICAAIEEADKKSRSDPTLVIAYSSRFETTPSLSTDAADKLRLPFFKQYNQANVQALRAAVKFLEARLGSRPPQEQLFRDMVKDFHDLTISRMKEPLVQQRRWELATLAFIGLSILLIIGGSISVILGNTQVGTLTSVSSILTTAISSLLFLQLRDARKNVEKGQLSAEEAYREALGRLENMLSREGVQKLSA